MSQILTKQKNTKLTLLSKTAWNPALSVTQLRDALFTKMLDLDDVVTCAKDGTDKIQVGLGYSFNVWNSLYFEPSYTMPVKEDDVTGDREGSFNFGLGWRF